MNFGNTIRKELISKPIKEEHCKLAFLAGLIRGTGTLFAIDNSEGIGLSFKVKDEDTAMLCSNYLSELFNYELREVEISEDRLNKKDNFELTIVGEKAEEILLKLGILTEKNGEYEVNLNPYGGITKKDCCLRSLLKGLFIATGSCTIPTGKESVNTKFHLQMVFSHSVPASETSIKLLENGIVSKITRRKDSYVIYIKSAESIKDFLAFLPAPVSVLKLTDLMVERELTNKINRQKNCDLGNVSRQIEAVAKQLDAIEKIEKTVGIESLKEDLKITAITRKEYPNDSLVELAERLNVSKSCLNHRLRKIVLTANQK